jgi:hypothetical protein
MPGINGHNPQAYLGSWKNWDAVSGNISGTWRTSSDVYVNHNGVWKQVWVRLTAPTAGSTSITSSTLSDEIATVSWTPGVGQEGFRVYRNGSLIATTAANATSYNDSLPALQTTYTYTVSAFAGSTETAQIAAGTARVEISVPTSSDASLARDWSYVDNDWDGVNIQFNISASGSFTNVTSFQYSIDNGANWLTPTNSLLASQNISLSENQEVNVRWRVVRTYKSVPYTGGISPNKNIKAGQPLKRNASQNFNYNKTAFRGQTIGETVNFTGGFGTVIDSYQFRNVDDVGSSLLANYTRRFIFRRPSGAGGDISIPFGSSSVSGTSDNNGDYVQGPFTNYVDGTYSISLISASSGVGGWSSSTSGVYLTFTIRFTGRSIAQIAVAYSIT